MISTPALITLLSGGSLIALGGMTAFAVKDFAKKDIYYGFVKEGSARAVMKGGSLDHFIMSLEDHYLNDPNEKWYVPEIPKYEVLPSERWQDEIKAADHEGKIFESRSWIAKAIGAYPIGLPGFRSIYKYQFSWNEMRTISSGESKGTSEIWARKEMTDHIMVSNFPYATTISSVETNEGLPLDVGLEVIVRVTNPYKALFRENWFEALISLVNAEARNFIGNRTFAELLSETKQPYEGDPSKNPNVLSCAITGNNYELTTDPKLKPKGEKGLAGTLGVEVISVNILTIAFAGDAKDKYQQASTEAYLADQKATAVIKAADAEAHRIATVGKANNDVIAEAGKAAADSLAARLKALAAHPEMAEILLMTDALKDQSAGSKIIWAANPFNRK